MIILSPIEIEIVLNTFEMLYMRLSGEKCTAGLEIVAKHINHTKYVQHMQALTNKNRYYSMFSSNAPIYLSTVAFCHAWPYTSQGAISALMYTKDFTATVLAFMFHIVHLMGQHTQVRHLYVLAWLKRPGGSRWMPIAAFKTRGLAKLQRQKTRAGHT